MTVAKQARTGTAEIVPTGALARSSRHLPAVVAWLDAEETVLVGWDGEAHLIRIGSDVPSRHKSSGHLRRDHTRFGGGGPALDRVERDRDGHLRVYLGQVAQAIDEAVTPGGDVEILGPGELPGALAETVRALDVGRPVRRSVDARPSKRLTDPQLIARIRERMGDAPARVTKG